jgi:hypothetical protein
MSLTNIALNSRSMNGQIVISDGVATISEGDIECDDINSNSLTTNQINTTLLTVTGKVECNTNGPYNIPTSISSVTGLLIGYGNVTNSGATDFLNFGSTYTTTQQGFRFWNKSNTQTLTNLAIIDNTQTFFSSPLTGCLAESPVNPTSVANKTYVDSNFVDRTNNLAQNINGLKTFTNNSNFTSSLLARTNIKLSEYENTTASINVTLTFPMSETIALRTTPATNNNMTVTLPTLSNNERGYVFTFNKLFEPQYGNFNVTFQTSGGNRIYTLLDQSTITTSNTSLLSVDKIQCKLAVGFYGTSLNYWVEQTDFSTYDRFKLQEWINPATTNSLTLSLPLPPTIALRGNAGITMVVTLPTISANERGQIFTFVKLNNFKFNVTFNTSSSQWIFPLNNINGSPTTNTTILPSTKASTRLAVAWSGSLTYWIEVSDYSTFDQDENNLIYPRLATANIFTNTNTFSSSLISNNITAPSSTIAGVNNIYTNLDPVNGFGIVNFGAIGNNINVKCNLNIVESSYNNPTKITTINQEGNSLRFTNNGSTNGNYIFTIIEGTTYNPLVINKTSVDIAGDAVVDGNLILYDTTPSTKTITIGLLGNTMTFDPDNTVSTTYNFKTNDSGGTPTTPLTISSTSTTVANALISNGQATFNNGATFNSVIPTTSIPATSANELVNYSTLTGQGYTTLSAVQSNGNIFTSTNTFTGNLVSTLGLIIKDSALAFQNGTKQINTYLTAVNELTFQPFSVSNTYKFQCLNATGTADKSLFITFDKTTIQMQLEVAENATFNSTATFSGDVTVSKTKNNSTYATYNGLNSTHIGYLTEVPPGVYTGTLTNTQYQLGAITLDSTNVGFWTCNYEVEINCITAGSLTKIYVFVSDNNVSTTIPITLPGAKANNFSTQTYTAGDSTYHSGSFSFLQSTATNIYAVQLKIIIASGTYQRKGQIRMLRIL